MSDNFGPSWRALRPAHDRECGARWQSSGCVPAARRARTIVTRWDGTTDDFVEQGALAAILARLPAAEEPGMRAAFAEQVAAEQGPEAHTAPPDEQSGD
jgi:hypothetical protein